MALDTKQDKNRVAAAAPPSYHYDSVSTAKATFPLATSPGFVSRNNMWRTALLSLVSFVSGQLLIDYRFAEVVTNVVYDYSRNDLHAVYGKTATADTYDPLMKNTGARFRGADLVTLPPNDFVSQSVAPLAQFTMLFWIRPDSTYQRPTLIEKFNTVTQKAILNVSINVPTGGLLVTTMGTQYSMPSISLVVSSWQMLTVSANCASACVFTAFRNLGEKTATVSTTQTLTDTPSISLVLGFTQVGPLDPYMGFMHSFLLFTSLLSISDLANYLRYTTSSTCVGCTSGICSFISTRSPNEFCLTDTWSPLSPTCTNACGTGIYGCTYYQSSMCFMVANNCHPTCYTCINGFDSMHCDTCTDPSAQWVNSPGNYWGQCVCPYQNQYFSVSTKLCTFCYVKCATCSSGSTAGCLTCIPNAALLGSAPNACGCTIRYFFNMPAGTCDSCDPTCSACVNAGASSCSACFSNAALTGTLSGVCNCVSAFFPNPSSAACSACFPACAQCANGTSSGCTVCYTNAQLDGLAPNSCSCASHYYPYPNAASCVSCHATCARCAGGGASACIECFTYAQLSTIPGPCTCQAGYYASPTSATCAACDTSCQTCTAGTAMGCSQCFANASLNGVAPTSCVCNSGYYPSPTSMTCSACDLTCSQCVASGPSGCSACLSYAVLSSVPPPSSCICASSYYPNADVTNCTPCDESCKECQAGSVTDCTACFANASLVSTAPCSCACNANYFPNPSVSACAPCDATCAQCQMASASGCTACFTSAVLLSGLSPSSCVCISGFYPNPTAAQCSACNPTCANCTGSSQSECSTCFTNAHTVSGSCVCDSGFYPSTTSANCIACDPSCRECVGAGATNCQTCYGSAVLSATSPASCICPLSFYPSPTVAYCQPCSSTCLSCSNGTSNYCSACKANAQLAGSAPSMCVCSTSFYPSPDASSCQPCYATCVTCAGAGANMCTSCSPNAQVSPSPGTCQCVSGYFPNPSVSTCAQCNFQCQTCAASPTSCLTCAFAGTPPSGCTCATGFYATATACLPCHSTCRSCSNGGISQCTQCFSNAILNVPSPNTCVCVSGYYPNASSASCAQCDLTCAQCNSSGISSCLQCFANAALSGGVSPSSCLCMTGFYPSPSSANCQVCHSSCAQCNGGTNQDCIACKANASLIAVAPTQCMCNTGFYGAPNASNCKQCDSTCSSCSGGGASQCSACFANAHVISNPGPCLCSSGFFPSPTVASCAGCHPVCQTCSSPSASSCGACAIRGTLPLCLCNVGYYANSLACAPCDTTCAECGYGGSSGCVQCLPNAVLSGAAPNTCICVSGYFPNSTSSNCSACDSSCRVCQGPSATDCTQCYSPATLTTSVSGSCACPPGFGPNPTVANCQPCDGSCATCSGPSASQCASCLSGMVLSSSSCLCPSSAFFSYSSRTCVLCHPTCLACSDATSLGCTVCPANSALVSSAPSACQCLLNTYVSAGVCTACPVPCATCSSATLCLTCQANSTMSGSRCVCSPGFATSVSQCVPCDASCVTCASPLPSGCLTCQANGQLASSSPSSCVCKQGYTLNANTCVALPCDKACTRCSSEGKCTGCGTNAVLSTSFNTCVCQEGYYPQPSATNCLVCNSACKTCAGGTALGCTSCQPNAVLSGSAPSDCHCVPGYYPAPDVANCTHCPPGCINCSSASSCVQCADQYYLAAGICSACLPSCLSCDTGDRCIQCAAGLTRTTSSQCVTCSNCGDPLTASATGPLEYSYNITFNRPVEKVFNVTDLSVEAIPKTEMNWTLPSGPVLQIRVSGGPWANVSSLLISFLTPVFDIYGFPLTTSSLSVPPPSDPVLNQTVTNATIQSATQTTVIVAASSAPLLGVTVGGGNFAMALLSQMQYFSYIGTANYSMTGTSNTFYSSLNQKSSLPNVFLRSGPSKGRKLDTVEELIVVKDFLDSAGQYLTLLGGIMAVHGLLFLLVKLSKWKWLQRVEDSFRWSVYLYFWYFAFLDLQICALLQLKDNDISDGSARAVICCCITVLTLISTTLTPFLIYFFIYRNREQLFAAEDSLIKTRFGALTSGLRNDIRWAKYLIPIYYSQRIIYGFFIVFFRNLPLYQAIILIVPCGVMALFTLIARPLLLRSTRVLHIFAELDALVVYILLCFATLHYSTPNIDICWIIVGFTLKSFACTVCIVLIHAIVGICHSCRKRKVQKIYTETLESTNSADFRSAMWADQREVSFGEPSGYVRKVHPYFRGRGNPESDQDTDRSEK